ncbi:MAG TPA: lipopolysaccharide biosynthesis protein [Thermoguttaceae bacterium]|nr:lipopolysaccharide biosynthesis protein [Thermoguttaceae bacterium]
MGTAVLSDTQSERFAIRPNSLAQSLVLLLSLTVIQRAVGFGRSLLLCRWLPPEELGHWDLTLAFLELAAPIAVLSIPACFARYVEHYRQQGQLRAFLLRTSVAIVVLLTGSVWLLHWGRSWFSHLLYGHGDNLSLIGLVVFALPAVILFNSINELFGGLRMYRVVAFLQFMQSMLFAALALSLAGGWQAGAGSVTAAFGLTCVACSVVPLYWLGRMWWRLPENTPGPAHTAFWGKVLPFVGAVWMSNLLGNLFMMSDRYMILHHSGLDPTAATAAVGQYHAARLVPLLVVQLSVLVGTMFVPYLSHDWEAGRRDAVRARLNLFLKVLGLGLTGLAVVVMAASPILFGGVFAGKFAAGEAILPWTLLAAAWFSMFAIAKSYLWCDERVWLVGLGLVAALAVNVAAAFVLLPRWGLEGAAVAACMATLALLAVVYGLAIWRGMRITLGTWIVSAVPGAICLGAGRALAVLAVVSAVSLATSIVFTREEKEQIVAFARESLARWRFVPARWTNISRKGVELECVVISPEEPV